MMVDGLLVTVIGIGVVVTFLTVLVIAMNITAKILVQVNRFYPEPVEEVVVKKCAASDDVEIAVAIAAAKRAYV